MTALALLEASTQLRLNTAAMLVFIMRRMFIESNLYTLMNEKVMVEILGRIVTVQAPVC